MTELPKFIVDNYENYDYKDALKTLSTKNPEELKDILSILSSFTLKRSQVIKSGGRKSEIAEDFDLALGKRGWEEKQFLLDTFDNKNNPYPVHTHKIDGYKNRVVFELEWNNKDPFFDRDLNSFRILHDNDLVNAGIIVTRSTALQKIFKDLNIGASYGASTTHFNKLMPKILSGGSGNCPILIFAIKASLYIED